MAGYHSPPLDRFDVDASGLHLDLATISFVGAYPDSTLVK